MGILILDFENFCSFCLYLHVGREEMLWYHVYNIFLLIQQQSSQQCSMQTQDQLTEQVSKVVWRKEIVNHYTVNAFWGCKTKTLNNIIIKRSRTSEHRMFHKYWAWNITNRIDLRNHWKSSISLIVLWFLFFK